MSHVFLTLKLEPTEAHIDRVMKRLSLRQSEVDTHYGLVSISPEDHLYTLLVDPEAAARVRDRDPVKGISGNPTVEAVEGDPIVG